MSEYVNEGQRAARHFNSIESSTLDSPSRHLGSGLRNDSWPTLSYLTLLRFTFVSCYQAN